MKKRCAFVGEPGVHIGPAPAGNVRSIVIAIIMSSGDYRPAILTLAGAMKKSADLSATRNVFFNPWADRSRKEKEIDEALTGADFLFLGVDEYCVQCNSKINVWNRYALEQASKKAVGVGLLVENHAYLDSPYFTEEGVRRSVRLIVMQDEIWREADRRFPELTSDNILGPSTGDDVAQAITQLLLR